MRSRGRADAAWSQSGTPQRRAQPLPGQPQQHRTPPRRSAAEGPVQKAEPCMGAGRKASGRRAQIEDPAPGLKRLRDRRDLTALAAKPWAAEAARQVCSGAGRRRRPGPRHTLRCDHLLRSVTGVRALHPAPCARHGLQPRMR